ncbi:MAG: hypothetical protein IJ193_06955 [Bacilli bacterium]|nr:hypothetical protein [Bacilli bacterium]
MNLSFFEKIATLFKYTFSSFLSIELFLFSALLFVVLIVNLKTKAKFITYAAIVVYLGLLIGSLLAYGDYVILSVKEFFKMIITYLCFPTPVAFFTTIVIVTGIMIYTLFSKKLTNFKRIFNYLLFSIIYFLFTSFVALASFYKLDLGSSVSLYSNDNILVVVQASNFLLIFWIIYTFFYRLYNFYKERFDEDEK